MRVKPPPGPSVLAADGALAPSRATRELNILKHSQRECDKHGHADLPTFGVGADVSKADWRSIFRQVYAAGYAAIDVENYSRWGVTDEGWKVLRGQESVTLRKPGRVVKTRASSAVDISEADAALLDDLKTLRRDLAKARDVPAYVIFADRTLRRRRVNAPPGLALISLGRGCFSVADVHEVCG